MNLIRRSVRFRVTLIAVLAVSGVMLVASVLLVGIQRRQLTSSVDTALIQRADDISALIAGSDPILLAESREEGFAQLLNPAGVVVASTPNLEGDPPLPIDFEIGSEQVIQTVRGLAVDDDVFRVLTRTLDSTNGRGVLHVGATFDVVAESVSALVTTLAIVAPLVAIAVGILAWWLVGRSLRPVEAIRAEVSGIGSSELHRRVPQPNQRDEVGRLAATMNEMLDRVESSVIRDQRFVADVSHELRSPLTRMRAEIEVELASAQTSDRVILESLLEEVVSMQRLVEDLLYLARADAGHAAPAMEVLDLDDIVFAEAGALEIRSGLAVDTTSVSAVQVLGDSSQLARAIRNIFDNALRHGERRVSVTLAENNGAVVLTMTDDGPGIPLDSSDLAFERFGRVDQSRSQMSGGAGLGLAITREILEQHGGTIHLDGTHHPGARFVVTLPSID